MLEEMLAPEPPPGSYDSTAADGALDSRLTAESHRWEGRMARFGSSDIEEGAK